MDEGGTSFPPATPQGETVPAPAASWQDELAHRTRRTDPSPTPWSSAPGAASKNASEGVTPTPPGQVPIDPAPDPEAAGPEALLIPGFRLVRELGRGGMAVVFEAWQESLQRQVAIKILAPDLGRRPDLRDRLAREASALAGLNHPNVVAIHDRGETKDRLYLVMEYVAGWTLAEILGSCGGRLDPDAACQVMLQVAEALAHIHQQAVVHRDVKPSNILVSEGGRVKLSDFGLAGLAGLADESTGTRRLTGSGMVVGTLDYMAPEQREDSHSVDSRADLYSFGVTFYEALTGSLPVGPWRSPGEIVPGLDPRIDRLVLDCLQRDPADRTSRAEDLVETLQTVVASHPAQGGLRPARSPSALWSRVEGMLLGAGRLPETVPGSRATTRAGPRRGWPAERAVAAVMVGLLVLFGSALLLRVHGPMSPGDATASRPGGDPAARGGSPLVSRSAGDTTTEASWFELVGAPQASQVLLRPMTGEGVPLRLRSDSGRTRLAPGEYHLSLAADGFVGATDRIRLEPGHELRYHFALMPKAVPEPVPVSVPTPSPVPASRRPMPSPPVPRKVLSPPGTGLLKIVTVPEGALASLGSRVLGKTPLELAMEPGRFRIRLEALGHEPAEAEVRVSEGLASRLDWALVREQGTLEVTSDPPGAEVWVDGGRVGTTPLEGVRHGFGLVKVELRHPERKAWSRLVLLKPGQRETLRVVLPPP